MYQTRGPIFPMRRERDRHEERPAREAQPDRGGDAGQRERPAPHHDPERDAREHRDEVRVVEALRRVAELRRHLLDVAGLAHREHRVAVLQLEVRGRRHLDLGPAHPRDLHPEAAGEVEGRDRLPGRGGPGDDEALRGDGARHPAQVEAALLPHHDPERVELLARADRQEHVPEPQRRLRPRHLQRAVLPDARDDDPAPGERRDPLERHALEVRVRDLEVRAGEGRRLGGAAALEVVGLLLERDPERRPAPPPSRG